MPVCLHLGVKLSVHVDEAYEQQQIAELAALGVELRCACALAPLEFPRAEAGTS